MPASEPAFPELRRTAEVPGAYPPPALGPGRAVLPAEGGPVAAPDDLPPSLTEAASPLALLVALRRRLLPAALAGLALALVAGSLVWVLRPDRYTAQALLRIAPVEQRILNDGVNQPAFDRTGQYQKTQAALLKSRPVLKAALKQERVRQLALVRGQPAPIEWLEKELKAELVENTELLRLSLSSRQHQADLRPIVNAVQEAYMSEIVKGEHAHQLALLTDMEDIYKASQDKLRTQREALRQLAETLKTGDSQILTLKQKNLLEEYAALKKELAGLQARLRDTQLRLAQQKEAGAAGPDGAALRTLIEKEVDADPVVQKRQAEVARLAEKLARIENVAVRPGGRAWRECSAQLEAAREALEKVRAERAREAAARVRKTALADGLVRSRDTEVEMRLLEKQREALQAEARKLGGEVDRMGVHSIELELKRNEVDQAELVLKALRNEKERLRVELQSTAKRRVSVLAPADEASVLNKRGRLLEAGGAAFVGLFLGLFVVSYRESRSRRIYTPSEVARGLRLRVMGTLPDLSVRRLGRRTYPAPVAGPNRLLIESIDSVRTMLLQGRPAGGHSLLMIASACSGEGKTTLAGHLAASLARAGCRTLLIDCDLRSPSLHRVFNAPPTPGMCEVLGGKVRAEEAVSPTGLDNLSLLAAGQFCPAAAAALARGQLGAVFEQLRGRFDFVVVDSSPVLAVPDALMIGKLVDGVVFSIRPGVSQAPHVYAAYERLQELGLPFVGVVVNGVNGGSTYAPNYHYAAEASN